MQHRSSPAMMHSPYKLVQKSFWGGFEPIYHCACYSSITALELGFQNLSTFLPTLNQGPSGCNSCPWYCRVLVSLLSWGGQQQILINEDLNKATVEAQLQIKRGSFEVLLHSNEGSFPGAAESSTPVCTRSCNGHLFVPALLKRWDYSRGAGLNPLLHYVSMGNKWLRSMTVAAQ